VLDTLATNDVMGDTWQRLNGTPAAVLDRANHERATANDVYGPGSDEPQARAEAAMNQLISSVTQRPNFNVVLRDKNIPLPPNFFNTYMGEAAQLEELRAGQHFEPGTTDQMERLFASDQFIEQAIEARSRKLEPGQNTALQALGEAMFRYNTDSRILERKQRASADMNRKYGNARLGDYLEFDFSKLADGEVTVTVSPDAGKVAAAIPKGMESLAATGYYIGTTPRLEQVRMEEAAAKIEKDINRFLRYEAHAQMLRGQQQKPSYVLAWDQLRYDEIFVERPRGK